MLKELVTRYKGNPILTRENVPYKVETVHNAGVVKRDGKYVMIFRSHRDNGRSILGIADSVNGFDFTVRPEPFMIPSTEGIFAEYEEFGVEDARINPLEGAYYITYSAYSRHGVRIGLARTTDFKTVERIAFLTQADYRNTVLFPEKIDGRYVKLDRPHSDISPWSIWISYSPDLRYWGDSRVIMKPVQYHWDEMKIGPGAPPIRTDKGWLNIYHGVFPTMDGSVYRLGVCLQKLDDPAVILGVSDRWILTPRDPWELVGYVHNVVFCCGAVPEEDGSIKVYWGAADTVMCVGTANIDELVDLCLSNSRPAI
ncbi:MAG: glycoside hydrolase family 130 protein [Sedimentisphaerales bacterium]|nr:glycoside hydrolase family 130 protein [Sedimentisphaerales bacterium]